MRAQHDFGDQSRIGVAYTDRVFGGDYNRVADVDGRVAFGGAYNAIFQYAESFDKTQNVVRNAPLWTGAVVRNGKEYGFRYLLDGISDDFRAGSGFISRAGHRARPRRSNATPGSPSAARSSRQSPAS